MLAGSDWDQEASNMAQDAMQIRWGTMTAEQKHKVLRQALQNMRSLSHKQRSLL